MLVPANKIATVRLIRKRFKLKDKDELRVDLKHLVYYTLAWIVCVDSIYSMHRTLKDKYYKYPTRMYWIIDKKRFRNAKYIYS